MNTTTDPLEVPIRSVMQYARSKPESVHSYGDKLYLNLSSCYLPIAVLNQRKALESARVLRKRTKAELARSGIHIDRGFHGRYAFWEIDKAIVDRYAPLPRNE